MAEAQTSASVQKRPHKGILKQGKDRSMRPRFEEDTATKTEDKEGVKWDEMNILSTNHPPDKDYGHMKIDEPKTPYRYTSSEDESEGEGRFLQKVNERLTLEPDEEVVRKHTQISETYSDSEEELTEEAKAKKKAFREWRKKHYDEFHKVKAARALLAKSREDDDDEDEGPSTEKSEPVGRMETDI